MTEASQVGAAPHRVALIETTDPYSTVFECLPLLDAGYDVVLCAGPRPDQSCPALDGQPCPLVEDANLVINAVGDTSTQTAIARGVREMTPDAPLAVIAGAKVIAELPHGCVRYENITSLAHQLRRVKRRHLPLTSVNLHREHSRPILTLSRRAS